MFFFILFSRFTKSPLPAIFSLSNPNRYKWKRHVRCFGRNVHGHAVLMFSHLSCRCGAECGGPLRHSHTKHYSGNLAIHNTATPPLCSLAAGSCSRLTPTTSNKENRRFWPVAPTALDGRKEGAGRTPFPSGASRDREIPPPPPPHQGLLEKNL